MGREPGSPETEPVPGTVRDHGDSFSDEAVPEIGLEGWILERQERRTLLAECKGLGEEHGDSRVWGQELSFCLQYHRKEEGNGQRQPEATEGHGPV